MEELDVAIAKVNVGVDVSELEAAVALARELEERLRVGRDLMVECLSLAERLRAEGDYEGAP